MDCGVHKDFEIDLPFVDLRRLSEIGGNVIIAIPLTEVVHGFVCGLSSVDSKAA